MPIYEYRCGACNRKFSAFFRSISAVQAASCPSCGSADAQRLVSQFAIGRSADWVNEDVGMPPGFDDIDESDPRSVARWMRRMGKELGEDTGPDFAEMVDRLEAGEVPDDFNAGGGGGLDDL